jgi:hypothetical protein
MKQHSLTWATVAALVALASGCADQSPVSLSGADDVATVKVSGAGQNLSVSHPGRFDLAVSGDGNTVQVPSGNAIRTLRVSGVNHGISVSSGASVQSIRLSGTGTSIHLPKDIHPAVSGSGVGNRILNNVEAEVPP